MSTRPGLFSHLPADLDLRLVGGKRNREGVFSIRVTFQGTFGGSDGVIRGAPFSPKFKPLSDAKTVLQSLSEDGGEARTARRNAAAISKLDDVSVSCTVRGNPQGSVYHYEPL